MKRNTKILIIVFSVLALALLIYVFKDTFFGKKTQNEVCPNGKAIPSDGDCSKVMTSDQIKEYTANVPAANSNNNTGTDNTGLCRQPLKYVAESFPLGYGMKGPNTKKIQQYLKVVQDGYYGCNTQAAAKISFGTETVDQPTFDQAMAILNNSTTISG